MATISAVNFPFTVKLRDLPGRPLGVYVIKADSVGPTGLLTPVPFPTIAWEFTTIDGQPAINVTSGHGFTAGVQYRLRLVVTT